MAALRKGLGTVDQTPRPSEEGDAYLVRVIGKWSWNWTPESQRHANRSWSWSGKWGLGKRWPDILMVATAIVTVVACALPWVQAGTRSRSSFSLEATVRRLGLLRSGPGRVLLAAWPALPMLGALVIVGVVFERRRLAAAAGMILGLASGGLALVVQGLPLSILIGTRIAFGCGVGMVGMAVSTWQRKQMNEWQQPTGPGDWFPPPAYPPESFPPPTTLPAPPPPVFAPPTTAPTPASPPVDLGGAFSQEFLGN